MTHFPRTYNVRGNLKWNTCMIRSWDILSTLSLALYLNSITEQIKLPSHHETLLSDRIYGNPHAAPHGSPIHAVTRAWNEHQTLSGYCCWHQLPCYGSMHKKPKQTLGWKNGNPKTTVQTSRQIKDTQEYSSTKSKPSTVLHHPKPNLMTLSHSHDQKALPGERQIPCGELACHQWHQDSGIWTILMQPVKTPNREAEWEECYLISTKGQSLG